ncbi:MAG: GIY-YIG nuclease family protein [Deferribacterales bacterium]
MRKHGYIYILTNKWGTTLYTGVTSDIVKRVYQHKEKMSEGFSKDYNLDKLVYYELFDDIEDAIAREKQIKAGSRKKKIELISSMNPQWKDLYEETNR